MKKRTKHSSNKVPMSARGEKKVSPTAAEPMPYCARCAHLQEEMERERRQRKRLAERCFKLQSRCSALTKLRNATEQMLAPQRRVSVHAAILELVCDLVGTEEVAVFVFDQFDCKLRLVASCGVDSERFSRISLGSSLIGRSVAKGNIFLRSEASRAQAWAAAVEENLTACIPLRHSGVLLGAVAIFRLLNGRQSFDGHDKDLLEAIGKWMSLTLYCAAMGWVTG